MSALNFLVVVCEDLGLGNAIMLLCKPSHLITPSSLNYRKLKLLENTDSNLCRATSERTYRLTVKLCPPPEDPSFTLCSAFSKSVWQKDYWQKEGAVDIWMKFYERGETRAEVLLFSTSWIKYQRLMIQYIH